MLSYCIGFVWWFLAASEKADSIPESATCDPCPDVADDVVLFGSMHNDNAIDGKQCVLCYLFSVSSLLSYYICKSSNRLIYLAVIPKPHLSGFEKTAVSFKLGINLTGILQPACGWHWDIISFENLNQLQLSSWRS